MNLPQRIFFTGVPGSRWSSIAQLMEQLPIFNTSDRSPEREYSHNEFSGHKGAYFGRGMEFEALLSSAHLDLPFASHDRTRLIKSHEWAEQLHSVERLFPDDWIMLVYRPDLASYAWWHEAGGFKITYPEYSHYSSSEELLAAIVRQNKAILAFAAERNAIWHHFSPTWIFETFGYGGVKIQKPYTDVLVTIIKS